MRDSNPGPGRRTLTWQRIARIAFWVGVSTCLLFLFALVPLHPRGAARRATCQSNLKQISSALQMYVADHDDRLPPPGEERSHLAKRLLPHLRSRNPSGRNSIWLCPEDDVPGSAGLGPKSEPGSYGYNWLGLQKDGRPLPLSTIRDPEWTVVLADCASFRMTPAPLVAELGGAPPLDRHDSRCNILWLDGRVTWRRVNLEETPGQEGGKPLGPGIDAYRYWNRY